MMIMMMMMMMMIIIIIIIIHANCLLQVNFFRLMLVIA